MATTSNPHDAHQQPLPIGRLSAWGFRLICVAIALSGSGCVHADRDSFVGASAFNAVPYQMPSSAVP